MSGLSWHDAAACQGLDPDLFFPEVKTAEAVGAAKAVCARCPVVAPCRAYAVSEALLPGIWGGTTEKERRLLRRMAS